MSNRRPVIFNKDGLVALGYIVEVKGETFKYSYSRRL